MNIVLLGLRGSGKTTVGRLLAARLHRAFVDLDDLTAKRLRAATVAEAFTRAGESHFRQTEVVLLGEVLTGDGSVVALGGGTPIAPGAADLLRAQAQQGRACMVYLAADAGTLRARLALTDMSARPSLTGAHPLLEIEAVHARRDPLYRELADEVVDTDGLTVEQALAAILTVTESLS